jgi:hypothetical protein
MFTPKEMIALIRETLASGNEKEAEAEAQDPLAEPKPETSSEAEEATNS